MLLLRDKNVGNGIAGTKVALGLSSAGEALGTQLRTEPCLDTSAPFSAVYFSHSRASAWWSWFHAQAQPIPAEIHCGVHPKCWGPAGPLEAPAVRNNVPGRFSSPSATAAAFPRPGWNQGSWFHLSSSWLFQALWWHHCRFPPTQAAWILGSPHTASKLKDTCQSRLFHKIAQI